MTINEENQARLDRLYPPDRPYYLRLIDYAYDDEQITVLGPYPTCDDAKDAMYTIQKRATRPHGYEIAIMLDPAVIDDLAP